MMWELWSRSEFRDVRFTIVDPLGNPIVAETSIGDRAVRLSRTDDPLAHGERVLLLNGRA